MFVVVFIMVRQESHLSRLLRIYYLRFLLWFVIVSVVVVDINVFINQQVDTALS